MMRPIAVSHRPWVRVFRVPLVLAAASAVGLVAALIGDGIWDALSWLSLAAPIAVAVWFVLRRER